MPSSKLLETNENGNQDNGRLNDEKLPSIPFKKFDPTLILLGGVTKCISKYAASRSNRIVVGCSDEPLLNVTATEAAAQIREGKIKSVDLVTAYIRRIRDTNPYTNAVVELFEYDALEAAKRADEFVEKNKDNVDEIKSSKPLLGLPVSVKNCLSVSGRRVICGLAHLRHSPICKENAEVVQRVVDAGGIPLCFTNVPPGCLALESDNAIFGATRSPHDSRTTAGGSSGGEGALIASQGSFLGLGTDIGGSIRIPPFLNGIYGFKSGRKGPCGGLHPVGDTGPELEGWLNVGPMTRYAVDLELLYSVTHQVPIPAQVSEIRPTRLYSSAPDSVPFVKLNKEVKMAWEDVRDFLKVHYKIENETIEMQKPLVEYAVILHHMLGGLVSPDMFAPGQYVSVIKEVIKWLCRSSSFALNILPFLHTGGTKHPKRVTDECERQVAVLRSKFSELLKDNAVLLFPALPETHYFHNSLGPTHGVYTMVFNVLGLSSLAVPVGRDSLGYPLAVQLVGHQSADWLLFNVAKEMETKFGGWVKPQPLDMHQDHCNE